jgi:L-aminopeptidase/D-esterase-like protein
VTELLRLIQETSGGNTAINFSPTNMDEETLGKDIQVSTSVKDFTLKNLIKLAWEAVENAVQEA